jgi:tRNA (guanine-N7-)-methyltransferase
MLGMEIRTKVADYVAQRIKALRAKGKEEGTPAYENVAVVRGNAMKYMANFFEKAQVGLIAHGNLEAKNLNLLTTSTT